MRKAKTETVESLGYMRTLPKTRWAWEFLRRNPDYEADYLKHMEGALSRHIGDNGIEILRLDRPEPEAEKWGLIFFADPDQTALMAPVFWHEKVSPHVISVEVSKHNSTEEKSVYEKVFNLALFGTRRTHLTDSNGHEHVLLQRGHRVVQMRCRGHSLLDGHVKLSFLLDGFGHLDEKFATIKRLAKLYDHYAGNPRLREDWSASTASLRDALISLDIWQAGKGYRDAAVAIYGENYTETEYNDPNKSLKNRMVRARKRGIELMEGGYLELMKSQ